MVHELVNLDKLFISATSPCSFRACLHPIADPRLRRHSLHAAYQNAVREQKLAAEISAAKRERDFYMGQVDKAKGIEAMKERKRKVRELLPVLQCHAMS